MNVPSHSLRRAAVVVTALAAMSLVACKKETSAAACVPGASVACACPGGATGVQVCQPDGTLAACQCTPAAAPGGSTATAPKPTAAPVYAEEGAEAGAVEAGELAAAEAARPPRNPLDACLIMLARGLDCRDDPAFVKAIGTRSGSLFGVHAPTMEERVGTCLDWAERGLATGGPSFKDAQVRRKLVSIAELPCERFGASVAQLGGFPKDKEEGDTPQ